MHHLGEKPFEIFKREVEDITVTDADGRWVHHPHNDPLVITTTIGNMNVHWTLVDNASSVDILYLGAYEQMGLWQHQLTPTLTLLYRFTGDNLTLIGYIKLAMKMGTYPQISTVMANFLVVDYPSLFHAVLRRPILKEIRAVTSIHHLFMKFPTPNGIGQVQGYQSNVRKCYNRSIRTTEKDKKYEHALVVSDLRAHVP